MPELQQEDGEVVDEEQRVDQGEGELHDVLVGDLAPLLQQVHPVEQPEAQHEHEDERRDDRPEHLEEEAQ